MEKDVDSTNPDFWTIRYAARKTPWDFGGVPAALKLFLASSSGPCRVLIPGCGSGYEVQAFDAAGYDVTAIDFSPAALEQAKRVLGALAEKIIFGDFFTHDFGQPCFDLVYERTFLCSMPPSLWPDYAKRMAELLSSRGRLIGFFFHSEQPLPGPPYPLTQRQAEHLFQSRFQLVRNELVTDSLPLFQGKERWQEWLKTI
jgi:Thiopurine S-methyltransferase (TPMT)